MELGLGPVGSGFTNGHDPHNGGNPDGDAERVQAGPSLVSCERTRRFHEQHGDRHHSPPNTAGCTSRLRRRDRPDAYGRGAATKGYLLSFPYPRPADGCTSHFGTAAVFDESILTVSHTGNIAIDGQTVTNDEVADFLGKLAIAIGDGSA